MRRAAAEINNRMTIKFLDLTSFGSGCDCGDTTAASCAVDVSFVPVMAECVGLDIKLPCADIILAWSCVIL